MTDLPRLTTVASRIIAGLALPMEFEGQDCLIGASVGLTVSTLYDRPVADRMIADADAALYAAKRAGRGRVVAFAPQDTTG
jgi:predicted signal transduction protein with EAL and GGDEF domain